MLTTTITLVLTIEVRGDAMANTHPIALFDLDGTLLDSYQAILDSMRFATEQVLGHALPDEVLLERVGQPLVTQMSYFTDDKELQDELLMTYRTHNENNLNEGIKPFDGIIETIEELQVRGFECGVVTSKRHVIAQGSFEYFNMMDFFGTLVGFEDSVDHKPDAEPLLVAAKNMDAVVDQCIYIGDSPFDIAAAHAANMKSVAVTYGKFFDEETLAQQDPTFIVTSPEEIVEACVTLARTMPLDYTE